MFGVGRLPKNSQSLLMLTFTTPMPLGTAHLASVVADLMAL